MKTHPLSKPSKPSKPSKVIKATFLCVAVIAAPLAIARDATTEEERAVLIRMASELEYLQELAGKASGSSDPDSRVQFDYAALSADLAEIQRAIEQHAMQPNRTPRRVNSLTKRYQ